LTALQQHLTPLGWEVKPVDENVSQESLESAVTRATLFHFCGHGRSDLSHPEQSALLTHPDLRHRSTVDGDPFLPLLARVSQWQDTDEGERYSDLPDVGRVYERRPPQSEIIERRLEYGASGTLWGLYVEDQRRQLAELWTASDIMVNSPLSNCRLMFLAACESGTPGFNPEVDEYSGLPAALQLAGVSTVVCTLWPVTDEMAALFVDLFYAAFAQACAQTAPQINIAALVSQASGQLRAMTKEEASERLTNLKWQVADPKASELLGKYAEYVLAGKQFPFSHPYDWASFYITGASELVLATAPIAGP
jgi:CHAT domain-containing protein